MRLLSEEIARRSVHVILGSLTDRSPVGDLVLDLLKTHGMTSVPVHVLSCHRHPEEVRQFATDFEGKVIIAIGGESFQMPAVLDSWLLHFRKHVVIFGIPVYDSPQEYTAAVSAMRDLPFPCLVHWIRGNSKSLVAEVVDQAVGYAKGSRIPPNETESAWQARLELHHASLPRIAEG